MLKKINKIKEFTNTFHLSDFYTHTVLYAITQDDLQKGSNTLNFLLYSSKSHVFQNKERDMYRKNLMNIKCDNVKFQ